MARCVEAIGDVMGRSRLRCRGHKKRKNDADYVTTCGRLVVEETANVGRSKKTGQNTVQLKVDPRDVHG